MTSVAGPEIPDSDLEASLQLERAMLEDRAATREFLEDVAADGDLSAAEDLRQWKRRCWELDSGIASARRIWEGLSGMQRWALCEGGKGGKATIQVLIRRGLMDDTGLTEKGWFVLSKGSA